MHQRPAGFTSSSQPTARGSRETREDFARGITETMLKEITKVRRRRESMFELRKGGWKTKLWGKRGKFLRIRDRPHQLNVFRYILRHAEHGAWVWYYTPKKDADAPR
jgi:hypothetical protein